MKSNDWRSDFPVLHQTINGKSLVYLDSAATCQQPQQVIDTLSAYCCHDHANVNRAVHNLSMRATAQYEQARITVKNHLNAASATEIVFVRGATEAINLVAHSYGQQYCQPGDEIIISTMEHHANIVPWQLLAARRGLVLRVIPLTAAGTLDLAALPRLFTAKTKLLAVTHISNVLGTINPIAEIIAMAHKKQVPVLIDGAQAIGHIAVDVKQLDCDFYVFSAHKAYGPTGVGVLYGKQEFLANMPPYQGGGDMIASVTFAETTYKQSPYKFEAGTPNIAGIIAFAAALKYITAIGMANITAHEQQLLAYARSSLAAIPGVSLLGAGAAQSGIISFMVAGIHPHDLGTILDHEGIAIRGGHHCAMPLLAALQVPATARLSLGLYNNQDDIDRLIVGIKAAQQLFTASSATVYHD
jgi:cysteine desulfurase/selenocysteine lyase